jgi:hypothetical protein
MTIARHPKTAISTTPRRLLARRRDFAELRARSDAEQSVGCVDPGPSGFDFSEDEAKHVLKGPSRSWPFTDAPLRAPTLLPADATQSMSVERVRCKHRHTG